MPRILPLSRPSACWHSLSSPLPVTLNYPGLFFRAGTNVGRGRGQSHLDNCKLPQNLVDGDNLPFAATRANLAGPLPGFLRAEVGIPERPSATLPWPGLVDRTFAVLEKHAVAA